MASCFLNRHICVGIRCVQPDDVFVHTVLCVFIHAFLREDETDGGKVGRRKADDLICLFDRNRDRILCIYEGEPDAASLARAMRKLVPKYMLPNIYEKLDALPMNANGKIDRVKLKEQFIHAED